MFIQSRIWSWDAFFHYGWLVVLCRRDLYCESMPFIRQDAAWWWYRNCYIWLFVTVVEMRNKCKIWTKSGRMWNISALLMLCFPANCCECLWSNSGRWCGAVWSVMWGATLHRGRGGRPSVCRGRAGRDTTAICTELTLASWPGPLSPPPVPCPV